ncbi:MAG: hypothetical protein HY319_14990, partial [Armatimonadetes bacterium]|nr:hypothetical protein [Armatimonadota bacterium]
MLLDGLRAAIDSGDAGDACSVLQRLFEFLVGYSAGVASALRPELSVGEPALAGDFETCQEQIKQALDVLAGRRENSLESAFWKAFFVGTRSPIARRHTRLLEIVQPPLPGYRPLAAWCRLQPDDEDFADPAHCRAQLRRYLPICGDWVSGLASLFAAVEHCLTLEDGILTVCLKFTEGEVSFKMPLNPTGPGPRPSLQGPVVEAPVPTLPEPPADQGLPAEPKPPVPGPEARAHPEQLEEPVPPESAVQEESPLVRESAELAAEMATGEPPGRATEAQVPAAAEEALPRAEEKFAVAPLPGVQIADPITPADEELAVGDPLVAEPTAAPVPEDRPARWEEERAAESEAPAGEPAAVSVEETPQRDGEELPVAPEPAVPVLDEGPAAEGIPAVDEPLEVEQDAAQPEATAGPEQETPELVAPEAAVPIV